VKNCLNGFFCLYLMAFSSGAASAQQPPAPSPVPAPTAPAQEPAQQPAPAQPGQPNIQAPPELPKYPDTRMPGEAGWWIGFDGFIPTQQPIFDKGRNSGITTSSLETMQGTPKSAEGIEFGIALGLHNALRISGFKTSAAGDFTATQALTVWGANYAAGNLVSTSYSLQDLKLSFEYLTWPYPVGSRRFRLKTLWQLQYVNVKTGFDEPLLPLYDSNGNPLVDANGNPISYATAGSRWFMLPTLGLGVSEYLSHHLRIEANASGFTIPHHSSIWDADFTVNVRVGHLEIGAGAKAFHFKTSTSGPYYLRGTLFAPAVQLRLFSQ